VKIAVLAHLHHPIAEPFLGGTEMHTAVIADELVRRGHEVTLFAKAGSRTAAVLDPVVAADFTFGRTYDREGREISNQIVDDAARTAIASIRRQGFDVVFNNSLGPLPYTELRGQPMLTVLHTPPTLKKVLAIVERSDWTADPRHAYVSVSELNTDAWRPSLPGVQCITNGIYLDQWRDRGISEPDLAVWSARITPEKGLPLAIEAARKAGMRLEIGGPIGHREHYEQDVAPLLADDVVHRGHLDHTELAVLLSRAAVFVASSLWAEPFGLALVEAMACGTPVAAFPMGAAAEVVSAEGGAIALDCSAPALAEAVLTARSLDRAGVRASVLRYDARRMVDDYEALLHRLVA
jgi:glycosyltransferase involved in cell wall biosynthesis